MKAQIHAIIRGKGEEVYLSPLAGGGGSLMASVQRPASDNLVNDYDQDTFLIFLPADDKVPVAPLKFDRLRVRGVERAIEDVQEEYFENELVVYILRVAG